MNHWLNLESYRDLCTRNSCYVTYTTWLRFASKVEKMRDKFPQTVVQCWFTTDKKPTITSNNMLPLVLCVHQAPDNVRFLGPKPRIGESTWMLDAKKRPCRTKECSSINLSMSSNQILHPSGSWNELEGRIMCQSAVVFQDSSIFVAPKHMLASSFEILA